MNQENFQLKKHERMGNTLFLHGYGWTRRDDRYEWFSDMENDVQLQIRVDGQYPGTNWEWGVYRKYMLALQTLDCGSAGDHEWAASNAIKSYHALVKEGVCS